MSVKVFGKGKAVARLRRHVRLRKKISGTTVRPRLCVTRANANITVQIIDDSIGQTIASASTIGKAGKAYKGTKTEQATAVGKAAAEAAIKAGIKEVVFDRGGNDYHGRVAAVADAAREAGLKL